jgi:hypothetical protein
MDDTDSTSLFGVITETNLTSVLTESSSLFSWLIVPSNEAAPTTSVEYQIGGTLRYSYNGSIITVDLAPDTFEVHPNPSLIFRYFWERDVYSDDPFTDEMEPPVPFVLGVMVTNNGSGSATDLRITSGQPEIIENEKGLLIDFEIIGSRVGLNELEPSLEVTLGTVAPSESVVAVWEMISSLQGTFIVSLSLLDSHDSLTMPPLNMSVLWVEIPDSRCSNI